MRRPGTPAKLPCRKRFICSVRGAPALGALLHRRALRIAFDLAKDLEPVLTLMHKYADVPMSLADACFVRMTETLADLAAWNRRPVS